MTNKKRRLFHFSITLILIAVGVLGFVTLTKSKKQLQKTIPPETDPVVRVMTVKTESSPVHIEGEGTVKPMNQIDLVPQVDGKVLYVSPSLVNGGEFQKGEVLLRIDPEDYELMVTLAEAKVKASESTLKLAEEEASIAREEWWLHYPEGSDLVENPPPLVAKEPQLKASRARLEADRADLKRAILNLERTELKAPFEGRVSRENVDKGQYVTPGQPLATLFSIEAAEIVVPLEDEKLSWIDVPGFTTNDNHGSIAKIKALIAGEERHWDGEVTRAEGKIDERTRMINIVIRVDEPYSKKPPLAFGLFVTVDIEGHNLQDAASIPRTALHQDDIVWVVDKDKILHLRKVDIAMYQNSSILIKSNLFEGEMIVVSPLKAVTNGMSVRIKNNTRENGR